MRHGLRFTIKTNHISHSCASLSGNEHKVLKYSRIHCRLPCNRKPEQGNFNETKSESHSVLSDSLRSHELYSPWNSPSWNTGVGSLSLLQVIFLIQESNLGLLQVQADSLPAESPRKPKNTGVGSLFLLQGIFSTQESNQGLLHCRWILYQLSCTYLQNNYLTKRAKKRNLKA